MQPSSPHSPSPTPSITFLVHKGQGQGSGQGKEGRKNADYQGAQV